MASKRILFFSNLPTPYQIDFFGQLTQFAEVRTIFLSSNEANRNWTLDSRPWIHILKEGDLISKWNELKSEIEKFKPNCVIVGGYKLSLASRLKWHCYRHNVQYYYWLEKPLPLGRSRAFLRSLIWIMTLPFCNGILCIGSQAVQVYKKYTRLTLNLPYSIDIARYKARQSTVPKGVLRCLFVGQYIERKGVPELLQAFESIHPSIAELTMVGSGHLLPLVKEFVERNEHIHDQGFVEPTALANLFAEYDVFVLPSQHDGWAVVVAEAMAAGLPVIGTTMTGAFVDLVMPNGCGVKCQVDAESIRLSINTYTNSPETVLRDGLLARQVLINSTAEVNNAARLLFQLLSR